MPVVCAVVTFVCCYIVDQTFRNNYITFGLAGLMGVSGGFLCAMDDRKSQEGHGK